MKRTLHQILCANLNPVVLMLSILFFILNAKAQTDSTSVSGQLIFWSGRNFNTPSQLNVGGRFLPEVYYYRSFKKNLRIDVQLSSDVNLNYLSKEQSSPVFKGSTQPYRASIRLYSDQWEIRTGLQKISFGSASLLRPLMWFDATDPRDPMKITEGVYSTLGRYYFLNNVNIWAWCLLGNHSQRGWDFTPSPCNQPEYGGRIQTPLLNGESGLSFHHRKAENFGIINGKLAESSGYYTENKFGIDGKWTLGAGVWFEYVFKFNSSKPAPLYQQEHYLTIGTDYTFAIGNGFNILVEHLIYNGTGSDSLSNASLNITASTLSYPIGLMNRISGIVYKNWSTNNLYSFLSFQRQYDNLSLYAMVFINPEDPGLIPNIEGGTLYAGKGATIMATYNF